jgi:putative protease
VELLNRVPNRGYSTGFIKGRIDEEDYQRDNSTSESEFIFVGNVIEERVEGRSVVEVRNRILAGEELEVLSPEGSLSTLTMTTPLFTREKKEVDFINHSEYLLLERAFPAFTILRKKILPEIRREITGQR